VLARALPKRLQKRARTPVLLEEIADGLVHETVNRPVRIA
jgi:hypothetical protein